jgi:hypothetical protein
VFEGSSAIHLEEGDCETVKITYNYDEFECNFIWESEAGFMYNASGIIGFSDGTGCEIGDEIVLTQQDLDDLSYPYGAWVPDSSTCKDYVGADGLGFFEQRDNDISYELYIDCDNQIITSREPEIIPYPVVFVDDEDLTNNLIGSCRDQNEDGMDDNEGEINDCLVNGFELDELQTFEIGEDNYLTYVATSPWYQAIHPVQIHSPNNH